MIEATAAKMAAHIKRTVPDHPASIGVLTYSLSIILNMLLIIALTIIVAIFTGRVGSAAVAMLTFALLRQATGGLHLKTGVGCVAVSTVLFTILSYAAFGAVWIISLTVVSVTLILFFAPSGIEKQSRIPRKHYGKLKWGSAAAVALSVLIMSPVVTAACCAQALTLIRITKGGGNLEE